MVWSGSESSPPSAWGSVGLKDLLQMSHLLIPVCVVVNLVTSVPEALDHPCQRSRMVVRAGMDVAVRVGFLPKHRGA